MPSFKDKFGRNWNVDLDMETAVRLASTDLSGVYPRKLDLMAFNENLIGDLLQNAGLCTAVLFAICRPQIKTAFPHISADHCTSDGFNTMEMEFLKGFDGDTIAAGQKALLEAIANFFPGKKTFILNAYERTVEAENLFQQKIQEADSEIWKTLEQKADAAVQKMLEEIQTMGSERGDDF